MRMTPAARRWYLSGLPVVVLVAFVAAVAQSFGRFILGVVLPAVRDDLGLSNTVAGSMATVNVRAYLMGTLAAGWATARFRLLPVMRVGVTLVAAAMLLAVLANGVATLAAALLVMGFGGALTWIPAPVVGGQRPSPERRGLDDNGWTSSRAPLAFTLLGVAIVFGGPLFVALAGLLFAGIPTLITL